MALANWSTRRILTLWGALFVLYGGLFVGNALAERARARRAAAEWEARFGRGPSRQLTPAGVDSLAGLVYAVLRASPAQLDSLQRTLAATAADARSQAVVSALKPSPRLSPRQQDSLGALVAADVGPAVGSVVRAIGDAAERATLIVSAVLLVPFLSLAILTGFWFRTRRRQLPRPAAA